MPQKITIEVISAWIIASYECMPSLGRNQKCGGFEENFTRLRECRRQRAINGGRISMLGPIERDIMPAPQITPPSHFIADIRRVGLVTAI